MTLQVTGNVYAVPDAPPLTATNALVTGEGTCVVSGAALVEVGVHGSLNSVEDTSTWSCLAGVAEGTLTFDVDHDDFPSGLFIEVVAVVTGAAVAVASSTVEGDVAGFGAFVQEPGSLVACSNATTGSSTLTWTGPFTLLETDVTTT